MFVKFDRLFVRIRSARPTDDAGASLILVVALMAMGFIISGIVAASCLFAVQQVSKGRASVQSFAAAEAGRDAVAAALAADPANCVSTNPHFTGADPVYNVTVYATTATTQPTSSAGLTASCPTDSSTYIVLKSTGTAANGGTTNVESVYTWETYRQKVAGGGLGFMDAAYSAYDVDYSGDIIVRHGDFTCAAGTKVDGSVYVLDGKVVLPAIVFLIFPIGTDCEITGDVVTKTGVQVQDGGICIPILGCGGTDSHLTVGGSILTDGALTINDPLDVKGDIEAKGAINVASTGRITVTQPTAGWKKKPNGVTAAGNVQSAAAISAAGTITTPGALVTNLGLTASAAVGAVSGVSAATITSSGSIAVTSTGGSVIAGTSMTANGSSAIRGRAVSAGSGGISGTGTIEATAGNIKTSGGISVSSGTAKASGSILAAGTITTASGTLQATGGDIISSAGSVTVTGTGGTVSATTASKAIYAKAAIDVKGTLNAYNVTAVGSITTSAACTIGGNMFAGGIISFSQPLASDSSSSTKKCNIQGTVKAWAGGVASPVSVMPVPTSSNSSKSQVYVKGGATSVQSRGKWTANGKFRNSASSNAETVPQGDITAITGAPANPTATAPDGAGTFTFVPPDYNELYLRTQWIDLGKHTLWNGYTEYYAVPVGSCGSLRSQVQSRVTTTGAPIVIDATACTNPVSLTGWGVTVLKRDAVVLVNNAKLELVAFGQQGADADHPRQLFIIQVDDDLTLEAPSYNPTGDPEPQPDCGGRQPVGLFGSGWLGLANWDPLVRVMLYAPCGTTDTDLLSQWLGHQYVANDNTTTKIIASVTCRRMFVQGTLDLPCSVNDFGEWSGFHTIDGKRLGDRVYQTEP